MKIEEDVQKIRQAMKNLWEVANDADLDFISVDVMMDPKDGAAPYEVGMFADTQFQFTEADGFTASYVPHEKLDEWMLNYDPAKVVSFTMPPKEEKP